MQRYTGTRLLTWAEISFLRNHATFVRPKIVEAIGNPGYVAAIWSVYNRTGLNVSAAKAVVDDFIRRNPQYKPWYHWQYR